METQLNKEMTKNEEALKKIQVVVKGNCEAKALSFTTIEDNTMIETIDVSSPSINIS